MHALGNPEQRLHVMTNFVRDDVRLREVAGSAKAAIEIAKEREIEIHLAIVGTIERSYRGRGKSARRAHRSVEQHENGLFVLSALTRKDPSPRVLRIAEHRGDKARLRIVLRHSRRGRGAVGRRRRFLNLLHELERVAAGDEREEQYENQHSNAAAADDGSAAETAAILDVCALSSSF